ncbi:Phytanoyl-CoA dioxygenase (PhyH) [Actinopolymorpha cephalotaxi]|uniref:Phytanoyl-CoA dioxygenase (PhyH) n=1 Tax=Actinopolymorpha cephalotaxi TaxID=504797 RepID=A0A1I3BBM2_9ACTN|nr:phytanoyl-CoA dioxygenase family protein [Actinopolymorpha cephalotaxi]NYH86786.1 hypothetical protein [Actinopolymorpha cephalotaxi]SFH59476.1 Phytanoyl-CoA dioxygenase (PhyH) [Actinopolymorpha cephalotaxi]
MPVVLEDGQVTQIGSRHERAAKVRPGTGRKNQRKDRGVSSPAPTMDETPFLNGQQVASWHRDGFLVLDRLIGPETTAALRGAYDDLLTRQDTNPSDRMLGGITRQVMLPARAHPLFDRNPAVDNALVLARQLFGTDQLVRTFDMLIYKPPGHPHVTPWHQDFAYGAMPFADAGSQMHDRSIQFWVPLDDVDTQTGCMQFVPGRHDGPHLEHYVASGSPEDEGRLLALTDPTTQLDLSRVVVAEIPAGGCTMHAPGTPHFTGANHSADRPRRSYIFNIGVRSAE